MKLHNKVFVVSLNPILAEFYSECRTKGGYLERSNLFQLAAIRPNIKNKTGHFILANIEDEAKDSSMVQRKRIRSSKSESFVLFEWEGYC